MFVKDYLWQGVLNVRLHVLENDMKRMDDVYSAAERSMDFAGRRSAFVSRLRFLNPHTTFEALINVVTGTNRLTFDPSMPVESAMHAVLRMSPIDLRRTITVHFAGQEGLDFGGVSRGFLDTLATSINKGNS